MKVDNISKSISQLVKCDVAIGGQLEYIGSLQASFQY